MTVRKAPRALPRSVTLVWDSSGSGRSRDHGRELALLDAYFRQGARRRRASRARSRRRGTVAQAFKVANGDWRALRRALDATVYDGATDLGAFEPDAGAQEVLLFTDGLSNFGVRRLPAVKVPLYAVSASARADAQLLRNAAEATGGRFIDLYTATAADAADACSPSRATSRRSTRPAQRSSSPRRRSPRTRRSRSQARSPSRPRRCASRWRIPAAAGRRSPCRSRSAATRRAGRVAVGALSHRRPRRRIRPQPRGDPAPRQGVRPRHARDLAHRARSRRGLRALRDRPAARAPGRVREAAVAAPSGSPPTSRRRSSAWCACSRTRSAGGTATSRRPRARCRSRWQERLPRREIAVGAMAERDMALRRGSPRAACRTRVRTCRRRAAPTREIAAGLRRRRSKVTDARAPSAPAARTTPAAWWPRSSSASGRPTRRTSRACATPSPRRSVPRLPRRARGYADSTAFFLDAADMLFERGQPDLGVRVLSNLAEMDLENRHILRILGYRLLQAERREARGAGVPQGARARAGGAAVVPRPGSRLRRRPPVRRPRSTRCTKSS